MSTLIDLRNIRLSKLEELKKLGINPYPSKANKTTSINLFHIEYSKYENSEVVATGRIVAIRKHGKLAFIDVQDASGKIQLYIKEEKLLTSNHANDELGFSELDLLDIGDYVEAKGVVTKTARGEVSVEVSSIRILTKTLRPLPDKWEGLKDKEVRLRRRYVDTKVNDEVYQRYIRRAKFWQAHREFLNQQGFYEMNIPVLETIPGGADAKPFITHMDALNQDFYLRISQELYLKRLIGCGYEKVYEIGPRFRNEGVDDEHLPEHIAMEVYWAFANWRDGMKLVKGMYEAVLAFVYNGKHDFKIRGYDVDFTKEWEEIDFSKALHDKYNIDIYNTSLKEVEETLSKHHIKNDSENNIQRGIDALWKNIRKDITGPAFVINIPKFLSPLSKSLPENPLICERFFVVIAGSELANGFSELNDPQEQLARFKEQQSLRDSGDEEAQWLDIDFVEMLEYGMPPTFGLGISERVFWFLEDVTAREGVPFPQLRFEIEDTTKEIYNL